MYSTSYSRPRLLLLSLLLFTGIAGANPVARESALKEDLSLIEKEAGWPAGTLNFELKESSEGNQVQIRCEGSEIKLLVTASKQELTSTLYHGVHHLGFLFPHPRW
jgi:hypothetical protein